MAVGSQVVSSSLIGASLTVPSSTALFSVGTRCQGGGAEWEYVFASASMATGRIVRIQADGTAILQSTALSATTAGMKLGVTQFQFSAGEYGFVATYGGPIYIACSGTVPPTVQIGMADTSGAVATALLVVAGSTLAGVFITTSASTAGISMGQGFVTYPRSPLTTATPLQ